MKKEEEKVTGTNEQILLDEEHQDTKQEAVPVPKKRMKMRNFALIQYLVLTLVIAVLGILKEQDIATVFVHGVLVWMLLATFLLIMGSDGQKYWKSLVNPQICLLGFMVSCVMILISYFANTFNLWLLGVVLIAVVSGYESALLMHVVMTVVYVSAYSLAVEDFAYYIIIGGILCLVCNHLKKITVIGYTLLLGVCADLSLQFIVHEFDVSKVFCRYSLYSVLSTVGVIVIAYLLQVVFGSEETEAEEKETDSEETLFDEELEKAEENQPTLDEILQHILNEDDSLLEEVRNYSKTLYMHCVDVGELSGMAAEYIGVNGALAKAGGLYHELGRIQGEDKNYIEEGVKLAEQNGFPQELLAVIRQHNAKMEKPTSVEAAIVMLTDSIISTLEYLESMGKQGSVPSDKLVRNILENRLSKGSLDDCALTVTDYQKLMTFYTQNAF